MADDYPPPAGALYAEHRQADRDGATKGKIDMERAAAVLHFHMGDVLPDRPALLDSKDAYFRLTSSPA